MLRNRSTCRHGFTLVEMMAVIAIVGVLLAVAMPVLLRARIVAKQVRCSHNLRQIGIALANHHATYLRYPTGVGPDRDDKQPTYTSPDNRRFSALSRLLPFLDEEAAYQQIDFKISPFHLQSSGDPRGLTGTHANEVPAQATITGFLCPADRVRLNRPWGPTNYRTCNGGSWDAREGDGMFGQKRGVRPEQIVDGLSNTAAVSERVLGDDSPGFDLQSDLFNCGFGWTENSLSKYCRRLETEGGHRVKAHDSNGGMTWLEGNMNWTRYNHVLPPNQPACKNQMTWLGAIVPASSRHPGGVNVLLGDGGVRFMNDKIAPRIWRAMGTINGRDRVPIERD